MSDRLTINCTAELIAEIDQLMNAHSPYVSRHRVLRAALKVGLAQLIAEPGLLGDVLRREKVLVAERSRS